MALINFIKFALLVVIMAYNNVKASPSPGLTDDVLDVVGDFSSRFTLLSKTYLDTYDLTDKRLVRDLSVKPSLEEIEWTQITQCWPGCDEDYYLGAKYLGFSPLIPSKREKCISFAQFVYFSREVCLLFNF